MMALAGDDYRWNLDILLVDWMDRINDFSMREIFPILAGDANGPMSLNLFIQLTCVQHSPRNVARQILFRLFGMRSEWPKRLLDLLGLELVSFDAFLAACRFLVLESSADVEIEMGVVTEKQWTMALSTSQKSFLFGEIKRNLSLEKAILLFGQYCDAAIATSESVKMSFDQFVRLDQVVFEMQLNYLAN